MDALHILFLGAGKRLSLFERMAAACKREGVQAVLFSYEDSRTVPVAALAHVVVGLRWRAPEFEEHLMATIAHHEIRVIIPCMDGATVALAQAAPSIRSRQGWPVVSALERCLVFDDKRRMQEWFTAHGVLTPVWEPEASYPWVVKHVHGFGARRQFMVDSREAFDALRARIDLAEYLVQPFVSGPEFTIDAYVSRADVVLGCVTRRRLQVVDGEVVQSITERQAPLIAEVNRILSMGGFEGPITFQAILHDDRFWFVEGNLRFGGGVILAVEAGADYAWLLVREALGRPVEPVHWREGLLMTRAYREVFQEGPVHGHRS